MFTKHNYIQINNSFRHALTFSYENLGFYSNFNNMVLTQAYCLQHRLRFRVFCKDNYLFTPKGWETLFESMQFETKNPFFAHFNFRSKLFLGGFNSWLHLAINSLYPIVTGNNLVNSVFAESRTFWFHREHFDIPELRFSGSLKKLCREIIRVTYIFNEPAREKINAYKRQVLLPKHYVCMHIRRGDKDTERDLLPIQDYIDVAERSTSLRDAFILTDDYSVIERLNKEYPSWTFYTLTKPSERGYHYQADKGGGKDEWYKLFAAMEVMARSDLFVGTVSTNPGMFLGMIMDDDKVKYLDAERWIIL